MKTKAGVFAIWETKPSAGLLCNREQVNLFYIHNTCLPAGTRKHVTCSIQSHHSHVTICGCELGDVDVCTANM